MSLAKLSHSVARMAANVMDLSEDQAAIVAYGLEVALSFVFGAIVIFIFAMAVDALLPTAGVVIVAVCIRSLTGGAHCTSPFRCNLAAGFVFPLLGLGAKSLIRISPFPAWWVLLAGAVYVLGTSWFYAPAEVPQKPIGVAQRKYLRKLTLAFLFSWLLLIWWLLSEPHYVDWVWPVFIGGVWQVSTLLPLMKKAFYVLDQAMLLGEKVLSGRREEG
jgi:accessory gene regulator B